MHSPMYKCSFFLFSETVIRTWLRAEKAPYDSIAGAADDQSMVTTVYFRSHILPSVSRGACVWAVSYLC